VLLLNLGSRVINLMRTTGGTYDYSGTDSG